MDMDFRRILLYDVGEPITLSPKRIHNLL